VIPNRYEGLPLKTPIEAAAVVCEVEKRNYLAHSIREIENALSKRPYFKHYRIITHVPSTQNGSAMILFRSNCCEIILPSDCETMNDKKIRLALGHELGHLICNMGKLDDPSVLDNNDPPDEEEIFAWVFAYHLIRLKSGQHEILRKSADFVYGEEELKRTLFEVVKEKNSDIYEKLAQSMKY
jgi:Zn-dependent peptidase ImmA (M78 family)